MPLTELDRAPSSCPYLFTWNGEQFEFVTDFLGGGEMGYLEAPPAHRNTPDPDEYVRITDAQLRERNGRFEIRVTNELEEVLFLDHLALIPMTHAADADVFPDEALRARPPTAKTYTVRQAQPPRAAVDEHGHDVVAALSRRDRTFVDDFALLGVRGYAGEHALTLDLAGAPPRAARERTVLLLTGWSDYAFSSDNVRAHQAGLTLMPPVLQVETSAGTWQTVDADVGIPVGRPQTLVVDVTPYIATPRAHPDVDAHLLGPGARRDRDHRYTRSRARFPSERRPAVARLLEGCIDRRAASVVRLSLGVACDSLETHARTLYA